MRTSFYHQPEAQHPNFPLSTSRQADYPIFREANRRHRRMTESGPNSDVNCRKHWTKLPMISTLDDLCWIGSKRPSSTSIVASLYRLAVVPFHLVQQWDRNVA